MEVSQRLQKNVQALFFVFLIILPFQTRYIFVESDQQFAQLGVYAFDIIWVALVMAFILWWYKQPDHSIYWPLVWVMSVLVIFVGASAYWTDNHNVALYYWLHLIQAVVVFGIVLSKVIQTKHVLLALVINGIVQSVFCFWQSVTQSILANKWLGIALQSPETSGVSVIATETSRWLRAYGTLPHPNATGGLLVIAILAAYILWSTQKSAVLKYISFGGAILSGFALILTFSRGAVIVLVASMIIMLAQRIGAPRIIVATLLAMIVAVGIYSAIVQNRLSPTASYTEQISISERQSQFHEAWNIFAKVWPYGIGIGTYTLQNEDATDAQPVHFLPLLIAAESGVIVAMLLYIFLGWTIWRTDTFSNLSLGIGSLTVATIALGFVDHYFWTLPTMLILWWIILGLQLKSGRKFS